MLSRTSVRRVAEALDLPRSTVQKIMRNIFRYYPYKLQIVQELLPHDFETRHLFSLQFLARLKVDPEWPWNILWTDEAHFHLDGSVNTHNCRIWETDNPHSTLRVPLHSPKVTVWCGFSASFILGPYFFEELGAGGPVTCSITGQRYASLLRNKIIPDLQARHEANPQVYVETPLHQEKLTVWCALWAGGIIGPYFFKNDEGHNVTVNGDRYRAMITNFFIPELNNHDVQELWFQQDCATCHTARATIDLLKDTFGDRLISRFGTVNWPPRSCDFTPLDYFLWVYVKSLVNADKPQTLVHLEDNICRVIADIRPQMLEKVIENWTSRLDYIRASRGSPMPEIIFRM
ncbi:transposable element tc3 transposase [Trichonephila clavipes]|nr:transposable element tc3 transposase [Trichonephila clavipes]